MLAWHEKLRERNERAMEMGRENPDWTKEQFEKALEDIGLELGITQEVLDAANPGKLSRAMDALLTKFPEIKDLNSGSGFLTECYELYQARNHDI